MIRFKQRGASNIYQQFVNIVSCKLSISKARAEKIYFNCLETFGDMKLPSLEGLQAILRSLEPPLKTRKKKMGGKIYPLPAYLNKKARLSYAINFAMSGVKSNPAGIRDLSERVSTELTNVFHNKVTPAFNEKDELLKTIEDNRPFMRIRRASKWRPRGLQLVGYKVPKSIKRDHLEKAKRIREDEDRRQWLHNKVGDNLIKLQLMDEMFPSLGKPSPKSASTKGKSNIKSKSTKVKAEKPKSKGKRDSNTRTSKTDKKVRKQQEETILKHMKSAPG